jgi:hypothetical protein
LGVSSRARKPKGNISAVAIEPREAKRLCQVSVNLAPELSDRHHTLYSFSCEVNIDRQTLLIVVFSELSIVLSIE